MFWEILRSDEVEVLDIARLPILFTLLVAEGLVTLEASSMFCGFSVELMGISLKQLDPNE